MSVGPAAVLAARDDIRDLYLFADPGQKDAYVDDLRAVQADPSRSDIAWRYNLGPELVVADERVLGLRRTPELEFWAKDGGPLTLQDESAQIHIALFERPAKPCRSTIALRVHGSLFRQWQSHLEHELPGAVTFEDHEASVSLYFADPDGNPYEITTYEVSLSR